MRKAATPVIGEDWSKLKPKTIRGDLQLLGLAVRLLFREVAHGVHCPDVAERYNCRSCRLTGTVTWTGTAAPCPRCLPLLADIFDLTAACPHGNIRPDWCVECD